MGSFWAFLQRELVTGESDEKEAQHHFDKRQGVYNFLYVPWCLEKVGPHPICVGHSPRLESTWAHSTVRSFSSLDALSRPTASSPSSA